MRTKLALIGLSVGVAAALAPLAPASAECQPPPALAGHSTRNECQANGCQNYDALKEKIRVLPDRPFECTL